MRYIWILPAELAPQVATLLIVLCGFAVMFRAKALAVSLFLSAILLLAAPLFDPMIDATVDTAIDTGERYLHQWPWWVIAGVFLVTLLLLLRAFISFVFNKEVADHATGALIVDGIRFIFRVVIFGPFRVVIALIRSLIR